MRTVDEWVESEETGMPFSHCLCCRMPLVELDQPWLVNKEFIHGECVLEYAVCQTCRDAVTAELSEESKESVRNFLEREINWDERAREFALADNETERFASCIACRTPREEMAGFGLSALFDPDGTLATGALPLIVCQPCIGRMTAGLSGSSREVWRKFLADHFAGPPSDSGFPGLL